MTWSLTPTALSSRLHPQTEPMETEGIADDKARIIELPRILDNRGNLSFIEDYSRIPFAISRTYWVYDVPGGESRGGHAYRHNREFIVALSGSFDVVTEDSEGTRRFVLNRCYQGLYIPAGVWRVMENFSTNSVALVLASDPYDPDDYYNDSVAGIIRPEK